MMPGLASVVGAFTGGALGGSFDAAISDTSISKTGSTSGGSKTLTTANVTVTASGGSGTYTYAWSRVSGSAGIAANSPSSAITSFSATLAADHEVEATWLCMVTDTVSGSTKGVAVGVDINLIGPGA